jgi:uncharacterized protein YhfF
MAARGPAGAVTARVYAARAGTDRLGRVAQEGGGWRPFELGERGTDLRRRLVQAVLRGDKTATSSLRQEYAPYTADPLPQAGERYVLLGYDDEPLGTVETTAVQVVAAGAVELAFARDEGEGFSTVAEWWAAHERFWRARGLIDSLTATTLVVCERFRLVTDAPAHDRGR